MWTNIHDFNLPLLAEIWKLLVECLAKLFSIFGLPKWYVHSDRGSAFMSSQLKTFLLRHRISTNKSTPYHPTEKSQCVYFFYFFLDFTTVKDMLESYGKLSHYLFSQRVFLWLPGNLYCFCLVLSILIAFYSALPQMQRYTNVYLIFEEQFLQDSVF